MYHLVAEYKNWSESGSCAINCQQRPCSCLAYSYFSPQNRTCISNNYEHRLSLFDIILTVIQVNIQNFKSLSSELMTHNRNSCVKERGQPRVKIVSSVH